MQRGRFLSIYAGISGLIVVLVFFQNCQSSLNSILMPSKSNDPAIKIEPSMTAFGETRTLTKFEQFLPSGDSLAGVDSRGKTWDGPASKIIWDLTGSPSFNIDGKTYPVVYLSVNPGAGEGINSPVILDQIKLAADNGFVIVDLMLPQKAGATIAELKTKLGPAFERVYFFLRFELWTPEDVDVPAPIVKSLLGAEIQLLSPFTLMGWDNKWKVGGINFYHSLNGNFMTASATGLHKTLDALIDTGFSRRVIGLRFTYLENGEWFQPPYIAIPCPKDWRESRCTAGPNGRVLWTNSDQVDAKPWNANEQNQFSMGDYHSEESETFKKWLIASDLPLPPNIGRATNIIPSPREIAMPSMGGLFLEKNGALYRRFKSERITYLQHSLARILKMRTMGRSLVAVNNGYLYALALHGGSLHTASTDALLSPNIDMVVAPYSYQSRVLGSPFMPQGAMDSAISNGKLFVQEDDSRPYWFKDSWSANRNASEDLDLLSRNITTAIFHRNGIYLFDLFNLGWFGSVCPGYACANQAGNRIWSMVGNITKKFTVRDSNVGLKPEIAIIMDERSLDLHPEFGFGIGTPENAYLFTKKIFGDMVSKFLLSGATAKHLTQRDLKNCKNLEGVKLIAFLGNWQFTAKDRQDLEQCLGQYRGKQKTTLYFQYLNGVITENATVSAAGLGGGYAFGAGLSFINRIAKVTIPGLTGPYARLSMTAFDGSAVLAPEPLNLEALKTLLQESSVHQWVINSGIEVSEDRLLIEKANLSSATILNTPYLSNVDEFDPQSGSITVRCKGVTICSLPPTGRYSRLLYISRSGPAPTISPTGLVRIEYQPGSIGGALGLALPGGGVNYCAINSAMALNGCGYTSEQYMSAPLISYPASQQIVPNQQCSCDLPIGLVRVEWQPGSFGGWIGIRKNIQSVSYCTLQDGQALQKCGFTVDQYMKSPIIDNATFRSRAPRMEGACDCP